MTRGESDARNNENNGPTKLGIVWDTLLLEMRYKGNKKETMHLATSIIAAESDNGRMTLNKFLMPMISHPKVITMARAQRDMENLCVVAAGL
ncbi:hypothetical protein BO82DRAFT_406048 [Aspergillus uvarum CBS 121591]|uniref:Uncharacterized protein n=1 Tax=Aspergillus uvarum CBS 121591 TaxID=1448315 RepID=A0A319C1G5_9EURO|nr:hypothetical protein BO82DRAFT_406048 [Aspergillus uvarum CBS 121591]PYH77619.1 hypothetical protein BO82DRAFT_406048 [Aspergillus uvarum CBS 121591]